MHQINPQEGKTREIQIVSGLKVVETEYKVKCPVFEEIVVKVPKFVDEEIKVPVGFEKVVEKISIDITNSVLDKVWTILDQALREKIDERISVIKSPKIIEEVVIKTREVEVEKPVYKTVQVSVPVFKEEEIVKPVIKYQEVTNAVIKDKNVTNAIIKDMMITNAIIKDVEVERAVIREKVIDVIHPRYLNLKGEPE